MKDYIKSCMACARAKTPNHQPYGMLKQLLVPNRPWNSISMDFIEQLLSWPWHLINPVPLRPIASMRLPPVPLYVPTFPNCLYFLCIATDRWVLCSVCRPIQLLNVFLFMIPVTLCSHPVILTNMIRLGESATNITELTHCTAWDALVVGLPDYPSIAPYILQ